MRIEPLGTHRSERLTDSRIDVRRGSRCVAGFGLRDGLVQYTPANCLLDELGEVAFFIPRCARNVRTATSVCLETLTVQRTGLSIASPR